MGRGLEREIPGIGGQRAKVDAPSQVRVELELPDYLRNALENAGAATGTQVFPSNPFGESVTVLGSTDGVSRTIKASYPEKDPCILPSQTTELGGPTSRRALP